MHDFTLLALEGAFGSGVAASVDLLRAAAALAPRAGAPVPRWRVCSVAGGAVTLQAGLALATARLGPQASRDRSTWIIPGLGLDTEAQVQACAQRADVARLVPLLRAHVARGGRVAAGCSAVFLLAFAGLLEGRRVTTTWWLAPLLQRMEPACRVDAAQMVCADGPIVTGAAAFAQTDLMLHLLRDACGAPLTALLSRYLLVDGRNTASRHALPEALATGDELVARIVARVEQALPEVPSVASLAKALCMSERTLARRVQRATGHSTRTLLQSVRLQRARALLERSRMPVEQVAAAVGYDDPTALRRLLRKRAGVSPRAYRPA